MKIVWDETKRQTNQTKHGLDFADLDVDFFMNATIYPAKEGRTLALGEFRGEIILAVIFAPLGSEAISIISMRHASRKERRLL
ncbi:BrnT family toxin [Mesorhizobium sp. 1B3]|uniref:BrnT family toxin n=1 Tax=Mesorhizobium sp. 1B3 TaxID=3243599 RepID=UPI003D978C46